MPTNYNRANLITESATLFPDNNTQEISPADLREWLADGTTSFVTQKDKSTLENAIFENQGSTLTSASTVNLNSATGNYIHISGSAAIYDFGTCPAGARFILMFEAAATLMYDATSLIIPGGSNKTVVAGDCCMIVSEGSGNWRIVGYFTASGAGGGTVTLVSGTAPIVSSGGTTPAISIPKASASVDGYLDNTDFATFNGKQDALTLTTTGTSGASTLIGSTLNIPQYSGGGGGGVTSVGATSPITSSGGSTPTISTSIGTGKLVGRASASTGVMEEITVGSGLTLTGGGTLNNTATPTPLGYYGAFQDSTTQSAAAINTAYSVKLNTTDLSNNVTVVNDGGGNPTRVTLANAGIYNIQFSLQLEKTGGSGNMIADVWIRKNGVDIPSTTGKVVLTGSANASPVIAAWNYVLDLSAGDYIQLMWATSNTNVEIVASAAASPHPAIPSAILTVTQQSGIMAGSGITSINSLTGAAQTIATGTSGTDFAVVSSGTSHTLNLPDASDTARGLITTGSQTFAGIKTFGNGVSAGEIRFLEPSASGSNYVALKSQAMAADYSITLPPAAPSGAQYLQSTGVGGVLQWTSGTTTGVSSVGTINSATKNPNGVVISGSNIIMQTADATNVGLVSIGTQTFAGAKTFSDAATMSAAGSFTTPQLSISGATIRWINFGSGIYGSPTVSSRSAGTRIVILETLSATILDHAIGQGGNHMWFTTSSRSSGYEFYQQTAAASDRAFFIENSQTTVLNAFRYVNSTTSAQIRLDSASGQLTQNFISFGTGSSFGTSTAVASSYTTRSLGTRLIIQQTAQILNSDYAFGVEGTQDGTSNSGMWCSIQNTSQYWKWMAAGSTIAQLTGAAVLNLNAATGRLQINSTQVVGARITGWGAPTGTISRAAFTTTASVLYNQAELTATIQALKAVITDLQTHGLIGA